MQSMAVLPFDIYIQTKFVLNNSVFPSNGIRLSTRVSVILRV